MSTLSDILLKTMDLNETYLIQSRYDDTAPSNNGSNIKQKKKKETNWACKKTFLLVSSCFLTVLIVGGFVYMFGPLVYERTGHVKTFNESQISVHHYRLRLNPNLTTNSFEGRASIVFNNAIRTDSLRLIAQNLTIEKINVTVRNHINVKSWSNFTTGGILHIGKVTNIEIQSILSDTETSNEIVLMLHNPLEIGDYMIDVHYSGLLNISGLDRSQYVYDDNITTKTLLVLKHASKVFPYFGNKQKIHFELSVARTTDVGCYSNVPIRETELMYKQNGYVWDHFKTTPPICPSSLGLIVSDYKTVNISDPATLVVLKMYAPKIHVNSLIYAANIFPTIFKYFHKYFQVHYPLTKLDLVLVDNEPISSKLGLISVDSEGLLLDIAHDSHENRRQIFASVSEAVALQWLNNNVNTKEIANAFGKYLAYQAEKTLNEEENELNGKLWNSEEHFVSEVVQKSLDQHDDSLKTTCILRMINCTLGERVFHLGFKKFMSSLQEDFWESATNVRLLGNVTGKHVLLSWLDNTAYPVITITRTTGWNVLIEQQSILPDHETDTFVVPLTYISQKEANVQYFTMSTSHIKKNLFVPQDEWVLFNYNQIGYYRVNYQLANWHQLITQLEAKPAAIPVINRAQLISDAFALADVDLLQFDVPFKLIKYLTRGNDTNYMPWKAAMEALNRHEAVFLDSADYGIFRKYKSDLLKLLWDRRRNLDEKLCQLVETELCKMQFKPCVETALEFYDKHKYRKDMDIPEWVYCTALAHRQEEDFDFLFDKLQNSSNQRDIRVLLQSLACTNVPWKISSYLEYSLENKNNAKFIWRSLASNSMGRLTGLMFLESHWKKITHKDNNVLFAIVDEFLSSLSTSTDLEKVQSFYLKCPNILNVNFQNAIKRVQKQVEWTELHYDKFIKYLINN